MLDQTFVKIWEFKQAENWKLQLFSSPARYSNWVSAPPIRPGFCQNPSLPKMFFTIVIRRVLSKQGRKPQRFETLQSERLNSVQCRAAGEQLENQDEIPNQIGLLLRAHFQLSWLRLYFWCSYTAHYSSRLPPPWGCFCQWGLGGALGLWWWEYGGTLVGTMMVGNPTSSLSRSCNPPPVVFVFQAVYIMFVSEFGLVWNIHLSGYHCCRALDI